MWDLSNEKHCPKCGGRMMDLVLTSYPGQRISKCMSCSYKEDLSKTNPEKRNMTLKNM